VKDAGKGDVQNVMHPARASALSCSLTRSLAHPLTRPQTNPLRTATPSACSLINSRRSGFQIFTSEAAEIIPENRRLHRSCVSRLHVTAPLRGFLRSMHIRLLAQFRRICFRIQLQALTPACSSARAGCLESLLFMAPF